MRRIRTIAAIMALVILHALSLAQGISPVRDTVAGEGSVLGYDLSKIFTGTGLQFNSTISDTSAATLSRSGSYLLIYLKMNWVGTFDTWLLATDASNDSLRDTFRVVVYHVNDKPIAVHGIRDTAINEDDSLTIMTLGLFRDTDGVIERTDVLSDTSGIVVLRKGDSVTVKPKKDWNGLAHITVTATDDSEASSSISFWLHVIAVNDPPRFIRSLPDTSLFSREVLLVPVKTLVSDVDNNPDSLRFAVVKPSGISCMRKDTNLAIYGDDYVGEKDTVKITATDPGNLSDTLDFIADFNKPAKFGTEIPLFMQSANYGFYLIPTAGGTLALFTLRSDSLMVETYNLSGQKVLHNKFVARASDYAALPGAYNPMPVDGEYSCRKMQDKILVMYQYGLLPNSITLRHYFVLDSVYNRTGELYFSGRSQLGGRYMTGFNGEIRACVNYMDSVTTATSDSVVVTRYDYSLQVKGISRLGPIRPYSYIMDMVPANKGYYTIVSEEMETSVGSYVFDPHYMNRMDFIKASFSDSMTSPVTQLIPYQNDNPTYPRNAVGFLGLFPNIKGYLLLYTKADVDVKITPGSSGYEMLNALSRDLYAYIVDSNLTKLTARIKLCSQPSPGGRNYRACFFKNGTYRIEWITNLQMTGQAYTKKWQFFDENMVPVSAVDSVPASDGMSDLVPDYKVFDDSLIIGTRYFSTGTSMCINTLQSLFENPTKNVRAPHCAAGTFGARFSMVMNPGRLTVSSSDRGELRLSIVNCLGRTCCLVTKKGSGVFQIPLRGFSSGVYLVRADLANGMSYRSKIILP